MPLGVRLGRISMLRQYVIWGSSSGDGSLLIRRLCIVPLKYPLLRQPDVLSVPRPGEKSIHERQVGS